MAENLENVPPSPVSTGAVNDIAEAIIEFDLDLSPECTDGALVSEIPSFSDNDTIDYEISDLQNQIQGIEDQLSGISDDDNDTGNPLPESDNDYYEVETNEEDEEVPVVRIPIQNYDRDFEHEEDFGLGWEWTETDHVGPSYSEFTGKPGTLLDVKEKHKPEDFFNAFFDKNMWTVIAEETNRYARKRVNDQRAGRDVIAATSEGIHRPYARLNNWKDINESDVKIFMAHVIVTGLVKKQNLEKYWSTSNLIETPFFGKYLSRNVFQKLLWNIHVCDNSKDYPKGHKRHDPLHKIRDFMSMVQRNFKFAYKPKKKICLDEACCAFKGRLAFKVNFIKYFF